jgi:hypothetical protein
LALRTPQSELRTPLRQAAAFQEAHAEVLLALVVADFVDGDDVRMFKAGRGFGFGAEALHEFGRSQLAGQHYFERDDAVEADLAGFEDHAHAPAGDFLQQFVIAEVAEFRAHGRRPSRSRVHAGG